MTTDFLGGLSLLKDWSLWFQATGRGTEATASQYRRAILAFFCDTLPSGLAAVDETTCHAYLVTLTPNRRNDIAKALASFFGWCDDRGYLPQGNPMRDYRVRRVPPGRVKYLSDDQITRFFQVARDYADLRAFPAFAVLLGTGARIGSLVAARCEDVDLTPGSEAIFWRTAKNGRTYSSALMPEHSLPGITRLLELAREGYTRGKGVERDRTLLLGVRHGESVRVWMREITRDAGVPPELAHPHALRRTFGTALARGNCDLASWVAAMGHSDASSFARYSAADSARMRSALARIRLATPEGPPEPPSPLLQITPRATA